MPFMLFRYILRDLIRVVTLTTVVMVSVIGFGAAIRQTLAMTGGNREQASKMLGIGERTLYRKLKEYGLK